VLNGVQSAVKDLGNGSKKFMFYVAHFNNNEKVRLTIYSAAAVVRLAAGGGGGHVLLSWPGGDDLLCFARGHVAMEVSVMC
jgi:hypothetical protein